MHIIVPNGSEIFTLWTTPVTTLKMNKSDRHDVHDLKDVCPLCMSDESDGHILKLVFFYYALMDTLADT